MNKDAYKNMNNELWTPPEKPAKSKSVDLPFAWFVIGWGLFYVIAYPIAKKIGYWTSAIPASLLLGSIFGAIANIISRNKRR